MNHEIKDRIEKIRNGIVPVGYKKTNIGIIPEEWKLISFQEISDITSSKRIMVKDYKKAGIPFYRSKEIIEKSKGKKINNDIFISNELYNEIREKYGIPLSGDLLVSAVGTLGIPYLLNDTDKFYFKDGNLIWFRKIRNINLQILRTIWFCSNMLKQVNSIFNGSSQKALTIEKVNKLKFAYPPLPEQSRIAEILSTWDKAIELKEKLIKQKKLQKKELMQLLLTGKKRLPGFSGEWKEVRLEEICKLLKGQGLSKEKLDEKGKSKCILYGELYTTYPEIIKSIKSRTNFEEGILSKSGDVLLPSSTTTKGIDLANATALNENDVLLGGDINILRNSENQYNNEFLANYLTHIKKHEIARITQGITIIHLYGNEIIKIKIQIPKLEEQQAIASVLSKADQENELLEKESEQLKKQKRSLMQLLLTGIVRV